MHRLMRGPGALALTACLLALSVAGCDPFGFNSTDDQGFQERLGQDLAAAVGTEGRGECRPSVRDLWSCRIESDPGSGWSGTLHLKVGRNGCWRARHVRYEKDRHPNASRPDLSFGDLYAYGRTIRGCTEPGG